MKIIIPTKGWADVFGNQGERQAAGNVRTVF
jgi:hypothetical protein